MRVLKSSVIFFVLASLSSCSSKRLTNSDFSSKDEEEAARQYAIQNADRYLEGIDPKVIEQLKELIRDYSIKRQQVAPVHKKYLKGVLRYLAMHGYSVDREKLEIDEFFMLTVRHQGYGTYDILDGVDTVIEENPHHRNRTRGQLITFMNSFAGDIKEQNLNKLAKIASAYMGPFSDIKHTVSVEEPVLNIDQEDAAIIAANSLVINGSIIGESAVFSGGSIHFKKEFLYRSRSGKKTTPESSYFNGSFRDVPSGAKKYFVASGDVVIDRPIIDAKIYAGGNVTLNKVSQSAIYSLGKVTIKDTIAHGVYIYSDQPPTFRGLEGPVRKANRPHAIYAQLKPKLRK